jgi:hypothetical protein
MYSCHNTDVFIVVACAACSLQVPTLRRPQDGRKWSAGKFKDMSAHQREAHNGGCSPESVSGYSTISKSGFATVPMPTSYRIASHRFITWPFLADWVLKKQKLRRPRRYSP